MMAFANCQSPEKLVVDNNICGAALRFIKGVDVLPHAGEWVGCVLVIESGFKSPYGQGGQQHTQN